MAVTVYANDRSVVHRDSGGFALASPDVCKTPDSGAPIPYTNLAVSADVAGCASTVFCDGNAVAIASSYIATSYGDEPGSMGGVISGVNRGKTSWITFSPDVIVEGEPVPRAMDLVIQNHGSPPNAGPDIWNQVLYTQAIGNPRAVLCVVLCQCNNTGFKMLCFKSVLANGGMTRMPPSLPYGFPPIITAYDPLFPGIWLEVTFGKDAKGKTIIINSDTQSERWKDPKTGKGFPLPAGEWIPGTDRPDVVIAKDPSQPLTVDNVKEIYEIKFDGDSDKTGQENRYNKLVPGVNAEILNAEACGCVRRTTPRDWLLLYQRVYKEFFKLLEDQSKRELPDDPTPDPKPPPDDPPKDEPLFDWDKIKNLPIPILPILEEVPMLNPVAPLFPIFWFPPDLPDPGPIA